jgi:hypothetical protein
MNPTDPTGTDPTGTDPTGTDPTGTDAPVTISEIAEFLRHLRTLSTSLADLFTRIAAAHPSPPTAPPRTRSDGDRP